MVEFFYDASNSGRIDGLNIKGKLPWKINYSVYGGGFVFSDGGLDWGAVIYPSGTSFEDITGGTHAELARRDIESCQACHDIEGGDPICIDCHMDSDGFQNTDPKTHKMGYLHDARWDWCDKEVSLCYFCHSYDFNKGDRFCGYCHS